ncbi:hypothetical protein ND864_17600 [Leptospira levettii]|uniref:hypothetical protein n=1 Tax=Leptospira levettii TaxID=2023178 RepID=UPI00223E0589|nr:hypothetical protein [Leptospira levettii]MCW7467539.1 hypothetical protein [Leptospira levettii]
MQHKETKTIVRMMENGNIRLSEDGFLLGEMSKQVFEEHYKKEIKGTPVYLFEKKATRLTA